MVAVDLDDQDATYLLRQYLRGRIQAWSFEHARRHGCHCGLDRAYQLVRGDYLARVDDTLEFQPGWLETAIAALEADPDASAASRWSSRPTTTAAAAARAPCNVEPIEVDHLDMRCFVALARARGAARVRARWASSR